MRRLALFFAVAAAAGCTPSFEPVQIVKDLRVIAMVADHPEVVGTPTPTTVIPPVRIDVTWADPSDPSPHPWTMVACAPASRGSLFGNGEVTTLGNRCEDDLQAVPLGQGMASPGDVISGTLTADLVMLKHAAEIDPLHGFDGVTLTVEVRIGPRPAGGPPAPDAPNTIVAQKLIQYALPIPSDPTPNQNPTFDSIAADGKLFAADVPLVVTPGQKVKLLPKPTTGDDEHYQVITFTNMVRDLHEAITYSFFADGGGLSTAQSGGAMRVEPGLDPEPPDLSCDFTAPATPGPVTLWFLIQDERGGANVTIRHVMVQ